MQLTLTKLQGILVKVQENTMCTTFTYRLTDRRYTTETHEKKSVTSASKIRFCVPYKLAHFTCFALYFMSYVQSPRNAFHQAMEALKA